MPNKKKGLKVGVIGSGSVARVAHIRWYLLNPQVNSVVISDPLQSQLDYCTARWPIKRAYTNTQEMLENEELDLVSICSHIQSHEEHTLMAAKAGVKGILCEKPMAPTLEECDSMINACKSAGTVLQMGLMKRFNPGHQTVKRLLSEGVIGRPYLSWVYWGFGGRMFTRRQESTSEFEKRMKDIPNARRGRLPEHGGMVMDHGAHYADVFRWWMGEVESVQAEISPSVLATLKFANGAMGVFADHHGVPDLFPTREGGYVAGTEGVIKYDIPPWLSYENSYIKVSKQNTTTNVSTYVDLRAGGDVIEQCVDFIGYMYKREIDAFIQCIAEGTKPVVSGEDGRACTEIVLAIFKAADEKREVKLPLSESPKIPEIVERIRERTMTI